MAPDKHVLASASRNRKKGQFGVTGRTVNQETQPNSRMNMFLNECWQIFVEYRLVRREALHTHTNAQSKSV